MPRTFKESNEYLHQAGKRKINQQYCLVTQLFLLDKMNENKNE